MNIDGDKIISYLRDHGIEYKDRGPDVAKNNINIHCPFCGSDDLGEHMGINLETGWYGCWRSNNHRGRDVSYLLRFLTKESLLVIRRYLRISVVLSENDSVEMLKMLDEVSTDKQEIRIIGGAKQLALDKSFKPMWEKGYSRQFYLRYLEQRGFDDVEGLAKTFRLHYCLYGRWKYRIILPIYFKGELVSWVGRTIHKDEPLHYLDLSVKESVRAPKFCLQDYDHLIYGGKTLFITEGFFDSLKLNWFLTYGHRATCLFTNSMTDEQKELIWEIGKTYDEVVILLDADALSNALHIQTQLRTVLKNVTIRTMPYRYDDPGVMSGSFIHNNLSRRVHHHDEKGNEHKSRTIINTVATESKR